MIYKLLRRPDGLFVSPVLRLGEVVALGNSYGVHVLADDLESALREGFLWWSLRIRRVMRWILWLQEGVMPEMKRVVNPRFEDMNCSNCVYSVYDVDIWIRRWN